MALSIIANLKEKKNFWRIHATANKAAWPKK